MFALRLAVMGFLAVFAFANTSGAAELLMVEEPGCVWCERWNDEIAPIYHKTAEGKRAPLRRIDISRQSGEGGLKYRVQYTPTFILLENGREIDRIEGYPGPDFFWGLIGRMLQKLPAESFKLRET